MQVIYRSLMKDRPYSIINKKLHHKVKHSDSLVPRPGEPGNEVCQDLHRHARRGSGVLSNISGHMEKNCSEIQKEKIAKT